MEIHLFKVNHKFLAIMREGKSIDPVVLKSECLCFIARHSVHQYLVFCLPTVVGFFFAHCKIGIQVEIFGEELHPDDVITGGHEPITTDLFATDDILDRQASKNQD